MRLFSSQPAIVPRPPAVMALIALACAACAPLPPAGGVTNAVDGAAAPPPRAQAQAYSTYMTERDALVQGKVREGDWLRSVGDFDAAEARYRGALALDASSPQAMSGVESAQRGRRLALMAAEADQALRRGELDVADRLARRVLSEDSTQKLARSVVRSVAEDRARAAPAEPRLRAALQRKVSIDLRNESLRTILELVARTGNINFVFDRDVKLDPPATVFVRDTTLDDVIRVLLLTNQLDRKVLNDNSILVYPATPAKQREYQELMVRSFYLGNADVKQTATMIKSLVKTRDMYVDEKLNLLIMRDTPDAIRFAEQLVATQDLAEPEVMLDVEVLEVASSIVQDFGLKYPDQVSLLGFNAAGIAPDQLVLPADFLRAVVPNPVLLLNLRKLDGATNLLANPRIRVKNREKARVHIGERVPVITTTSTANVGVSSSVNYLETGLKLDVEPNIFREDEVSIKVQLEVSNILEQLNVSGTVAYRLGARNAMTTLRLKDGETQVLAGLINNEDRKSFAKVPYAGDLPVLGRLFRSDSINGSKTEIVLLITPRVLRNVSRPDTVAELFTSGTEAVPGSSPLRLVGSTGFGMAQAPAPAAAATPVALKEDAPLAITAEAASQVAVGGEFGLSLSLPAGNEALRASVRVTYDPTVLSMVNASGRPGAGDGGRATVELASGGVAGIAQPSTQVRFKVVGKSATQTDIGLEVQDGNRRLVVAPEVRTISVVER